MKKCVFNLDLDTMKSVVRRRFAGSEFQARAPETARARSPKSNLVRGMSSFPLVAERSVECDGISEILVNNSLYKFIIKL